MEKLSIMKKATMTAVVEKLEYKGGPLIGSRFLPFKNVATMKTFWDVLSTVNRMASIRSIDGEAELKGRVAYDRMYADMTDIAEKETFKASEIIEAKLAGELSEIKEGMEGQLMKSKKAAFDLKVREALERIKKSILNRVEYLQVNALMGEISYNEGGVQIEVDYGIPGDQKNLTPEVAWSTVETADPLADIQAWQAIVEDKTGITPKVLIMSITALRYISKNSAIRDALKYTSPIFSVSAVKRFIEEEAGVEIVTYDTKYTDETGGNTERFMPVNKLIMLPSAEDLTDGIGDTAQTGHPHNGFVPGFYNWEESKQDPYGVTVGVGRICFPRIKHPDAILTADLFDVE